jgi:hypothetical protein
LVPSHIFIFEAPESHVKVPAVVPEHVANVVPFIELQFVPLQKFRLPEA